MNKDVVNIICMKWGDKFPAEYVNRLYGMVERSLSLPFRFVCFTENSNDIRDEVEIQALPELDLPPGAPVIKSFFTRDLDIAIRCYKYDQYLQSLIPNARAMKVCDRNNIVIL